MLTPFTRLAVSIDPLLVWNYGTMAVLAGVAGVLFWITTRRLDAQEDALNNLNEGRLNNISEFAPHAGLMPSAAPTN
jgi:POT family proton-dependent oligopeptide transporter